MNKNNKIDIEERGFSCLKATDKKKKITGATRYK